ncbi:dynein heavy chain 9, axonemal-like [Myzus persicae]|uniref:dynein heavy chain 9, axonemal-like n=1 Tax=Myzus persicae TaxID=13164 RepID=UPI000B9391F3|nr:dynein heavy chain 9, axonemal-like [Myzus persicae]
MVFGSAVLNRPMVAAAVEKHYEKVLDLLDQDLAQELKIIDRLSGTAMVTEIEKSDYYETRFIPEEMDLEYPLVARAMMWGNSRLNNRLLEDLNVIRSFDLPIMKTPRGDQINIKSEQLKDKFKNYLSPIIEEWKRVVPLQIQDKIVQPLFTINKNNIISLNFSEELDAAIKVTRYIILCNYNFKNPILTIETDDIPYEAIKLYKREKLILEYKRDIEEIVKWYNMLRTETHPTELQLIIQEIENIDNLIDDAQKYVTWNTEDIVYSSENDLHEETYTESEQFMSPVSLQNTISTIHSLTKNVYERVIQTHENFQKIITLSSQWNNKPMYVRDKNTNRITFDNKLTEKKIARYAEVRDASIEIQQLLMEDLLLFHNVPLLDPNLETVLEEMEEKILDGEVEEVEGKKYGEEIEEILDEEVEGNNYGEETIDDDEIEIQTDTILEEFIEGEVEEEYYGEQKQDYIHIQAEIILSNIERKLMWDKYKLFVDEIVFTELQDATLCR